MKTAGTPKSKKPGETPTGVSRRSFLNILWTALGLAALAEVLWLAVSFLWPSRTGGAESQAHSVVSAGSLTSYEPGTVTAFQKGEFYLVRLKRRRGPGAFLQVHPSRMHRPLGRKGEEVPLPVPRLGVRHRRQRDQLSGRPRAGYLPGEHREQHREGRHRPEDQTQPLRGGAGDISTQGVNPKL